MTLLLLGEKCDAQKVVRDAVIAIIRYHENSRNDNGTVCMMGKYHDILYVGVKICYDWQLNDTATVATLLDHIYSCEKTFERLFVGAIFGTRAPHFIAGWKSDFNDQEENLRAVVYFLDHATTANLEYIYGNDTNYTRYIDIPIESCGKSTCIKITVQLGIPDKLHILLRFGAVVDSLHEENAMECILNKLIEFDNGYPYNLVACLQVLLRAIPSVKTKSMYENNLDDKLDYFNIQKDYLESNYGQLIENCILPINRCGIEPVPLKHMCRCIIRQQLWYNYQLPNGIRNLPLPKILHRYLDLLED